MTINRDAEEGEAPLRRGTVFLILTIITLLGITVSLAWFIHTPTNYQERFNVQFAGQPNRSAITDGSPDNPMPLYYLLLHGLAEIRPPDITFIRAVSLASYAMLIPAMYITSAYATRSQRAGLLATTLLAISPFMLWYANRATVYAPIVLAAILNQLAFMLILRKNNWGWPLYILTALAGMGLHYFFATVVVLQLLFSIIKWHGYNRTYRFAMLGTSILLIAGFALWIHHLQQVMHFFDVLPYTGKPSATNAFIIYIQYLFGFQSVQTIAFTMAFWPLLVSVALFAVQKYVQPSTEVQYALFSASMIVLGTFLVSWIWRPLFLSSYLIIGLPSFMLIIGWYLVAFKLNILVWARTAIIGAMIIMLIVQSLNIQRAVQGDYLGTLVKPAQSVASLNA